ncbi:transposase [Kallotenue papyrolyticum]|uniref:transposase n=1 Tax=Kallotenue papyrolyticum TaxID=1325125 RepID=UPI0004785A52|nr:transposase [Kallotenue papyrolyticum]
MTYDPQRHHRRSIRLKGYDYAQPGAYFITICTQHRACLFGEVVDGEMRLNDYGKIVEFTWHDLVNHISGIMLDAFVVMPNHVHGIVIITDGPGVVGAGSEPAPTTPATAHTARHGLPEIVRQFKTFSARRINALRGTPGVSVWQRNYYEHIIRNDEALERIRRYILENPARWMRDREKPRAIRPEPEDTWAQ